MSGRDHLETTSAYFDGELADAEAQDAAIHLASCTACQELLATAAGIDAVKPRVSTRARRRTAIFVGASVLAAAAIVLVVVRPWRHASEAPPSAIALAHDRVLEARFSGAAFAAHRPFVAVRGADVAHEPISLAALAELDKRGDRADLVAALAASGELARATEAAAALPDSLAADIDRAAVALAAHQPEVALGHAYRALDRDPSSLPARWNLALAARDLDLPQLARDAFARVASADAPAWSAEARTRAAALDDELAPVEREYTAFEQRSRAMVAGGAPLSADDAQRYPGLARFAFYDAVRLAAGKDRLAALRPLATALDAATPTPNATAAIDRIAPAHLGIRASFAADYRAVVDGRAQPEQVTALIARLERAGDAVADLLVGTLVLGGLAPSHADELARLVAPWHDPWFDIVATRARATGTDLHAEPELADALAACGDAVALRCGQLAFDLAQLHAATGLDGEAEIHAATALRWYRRAVAPAYARAALATLADQHRLHGRAALARAELENVVLTTTGTADCDAHRNAQIGLADLALAVGAWDRTRAVLPPIEHPAACLDPDGVLPVSLAADLARHTKDPRDVDVAARWIAAVPAGETYAGIAAVAALRIGRGDAAPVHAWLDRHATDRDPTIDGIRAWAIGTFVDDAGAAGDWRGAMVAVDPRAATQACAVVASLDDDRLVVAAVHGGHVAGDARVVAASDLGTTRIVPDAIVHELGACDAIAVYARPPLHGRDDLLPRELPWFFVGDSAHVKGRAPRAKTVEVVDAHPPAALGAGTLPAMRARDGFTVSLAGDAATPSATLAALADATYAELHVHGIVSATDDGAAFLALSPDAHGEFALRADAVERAKLAGAPTVVLAACRASTVAPYLSLRWSLPDAFVTAGASAVIAVDRPIDDATARTVFDELRRRVLANEPIERAVAAIRTTATAPWAQRLMVFE